LHLERPSFIVLRISIDGYLGNYVPEQKSYGFTLIAHKGIFSLLYENLGACLAFFETLSEEIVR
jgi:hypothetical protein